MIPPLLEYTTVPIEISVKTTAATWEYPGTAELAISNGADGVSVKSGTIHVPVSRDSFERRGGGSGGFQFKSHAHTPHAQKTYSATSAFANHGQITLNAMIGQQAPISTGGGQTDGGADIPVTAGTGTSGVDASPAANTAQMDVASVQIRYGMDQVYRHHKERRGDIKFIPGDIEFTVEQMPSLTIKYTGGPFYVPRSADPNYHPVDVKA